MGDICLFFSWLDNCPNTVLEALACGVPVICTNQGGTHELIEKTKGGLIVEADVPFHFKPVDLYHPPVPDQNALVRAVVTMVERHKEFAAAIDRTAIDIDIVAQRYVDFAEKVYRNKLV
jgi:glycosyltransferase involved in cell wall biosynthesis